MKNVMIANLNKKSKFKMEDLLVNLKAQLENSFELNWKPEDICLVANFDFEYQGVKTMQCDLNRFCLTGSKLFGLQWLMQQKVDTVYWTHDLDCWQGVEFQCPDFKDIGICEYSSPRYNGGSVFWRDTGADIVDVLIQTITEENSKKEEPILNRLLKQKEYDSRVTVLNSTFNVGCSGFVKRYERAIKPIHVSHFHPTNRIAWDTHALDRNRLGSKSICARLEKLIRRFYPNLAEVSPPNRHDKPKD
jgi:hypothetical protein